MGNMIDKEAALAAIQVELDKAAALAAEYAGMGITPVLGNPSGEAAGLRHAHSLVAAIPAAPTLGDALEDVAAALWRAEAVDSGTPKSVVDGRTREAFKDQSEELRRRWKKFASAAISAIRMVVRDASD
jgi:hypothetical protein